MIGLALLSIGNVVGVRVAEHVVLHLVNRHAAHRSADNAEQLTLAS